MDKNDKSMDKNLKNMKDKYYDLRIKYLTLQEKYSKLKDKYHKKNDKIYISLTTIPSRVNELEPILDSILDQTHNIEKILLNIPKYSLRFKTKYKIPIYLNKEKYINKLVIIECEDYGPGTKLLGCLKYFSNMTNKKNIYIIIIDDDRILNKNLVSHLYSNQIKNKNCIIANKGSNQELPVKIPWGAGGMSIPLKLINKNDIYSFFKKHECNCRYVDDVFWYKYFYVNKKIEIKYFETITLNYETNNKDPLWQENGELQRYNRKGIKGLNQKCFES